MVSGTLKAIPDKHFYYFGTCIGELKDLDSLNTAKISEIQNSICDDKVKLKAYTDIFAVLKRTSEILENSANDQSLCLYITDDEQSEQNKSTNISESLKSAKNNLQKFKNAGVVFQLVKIKGASSNFVMSSDVLKEIFSVNEVESANFGSMLTNIFKERFIKEDLIPFKTEKPNSNNKIIFKYKNFKTFTSGIADAEIEISNHYKSFSPIVKIDSVVGKNWKAVPEKVDSGIPYFNIDQEEVKKAVRFNVQSHKGIQFFNQSLDEEIRTYYTVIVPGSQQYDIQKYFTDNKDFKVSESNSVLKNALFATYNSSYKKDNLNKTTYWMLFVYGLFSFLLAKFLNKLLKPTLKGKKFPY